MADLLSTFLEPLGAESMLRTLFDFTLKGVLILSFAGIITTVIRGTSAATRHWIWFVAMSSVLCIPLFSSILPTWNVALLPEWQVEVVPAMVPGAATSPTSLSSTPEPALVTPDPNHGIAASPPPLVPKSDQAHYAANQKPALATLLASYIGLRDLHWSAWLVLIWAVGMMVILLQLLVGAVGVWIMARRARPITDPAWIDLADELGDRLFLTRPVRLLQSRATAMPMTWGGLNPVVLLPVDSDAWDDERRRCVLMHEFAHIKRWDCVTQTFAQLTCAVFWFNPFVWMAARQLRIEREKACDDYVISYGTVPSNYAGHLLDIARTLKVTLVSPLGAVAMARPSQLEGRVLSILDPERRRGVNRVPALLSLALALMVLLPLAAMRPWATTATPEAEAPVLVEPTAEPIQPTSPSEPTQPTQPAIVFAQTDTIPGGDKTKEEVALALMEALDDEDEEIRNRVVHTLGELGQEVSVEEIGQVLMNDASPRVRKTAAWALGEMQHQRSVDALMAALKDESGEVRKMATWGLGEIGDPRAIPSLINALGTEDKAEVRKKMVWAMGEMQDIRALEGLMEAARDEDLEVRNMAVWALAELDDARAIPVLLVALEDQDAEIRRRVVWALGELEDVRALDGLMKAVRDSDAEVRSMAVWALAELGDPRAYDVLIEAVRDENPETREKAVWALGEFADVRAVPSLTLALRDSDAEVRRKAAWALGEIDDPVALDALMVALKDSDRQVRNRAVHALGELEASESVDALIQILTDEDAEIRSNAAWALGEIGATKSVGALSRTLLNDSEASVRKRAAWALGEIGSSDAIDALKKALKDEDKEVRKMAAWALGEMDYS